MTWSLPRHRVLTPLVGLAALALGACTEPAKVAGPRAPAPGNDPRLALLDPGASGLIVICASGGAASFSASATPAVGTLLGGGSFSVADGACATAWTAAVGDYTTVEVVVTQTSANFGSIEATAVPPEGLPRMTVNQSTQTVAWFTNVAHGGSATFNQAPPPSPPPPRKLVLCKEGPSGTFTFTVSATGGTGSTFPNGNEFTIVAGECKDVWFDNSIDQPGLALDDDTEVTVSEVGSAPLDSIRKALDYEPAVVITGTRSVTSRVNYFHGGVLTYYNAMRPPRGGEGCTPGYWKQSQHFGSWTSPYVPTGAGATDFDAAFGVDAFDPNITLLAALGRNGGGINALARHAAAALLNAANPDVSSNLEVSEVIAMVQSAIASGDYETTKNVLAQYNEQGCPLGRNP